MRCLGAAETRLPLFLGNGPYIMFCSAKPSGSAGLARGGRLKILRSACLAFAALAMVVLSGAAASAAPLLPHTANGSPADCSNTLTVIKPEYWLSRVYLIPVAFHVITQADGTTGALTDQQINDQIQVLNEDFRALPGSLGADGYDTRIQFVLKEITRSANDAWCFGAGSAEVEYTAALARDPHRFLNIYSNFVEGYAGDATSPVTQAGHTDDGVTLAWNLVGGRDQDNGTPTRNQGRNAVHYVSRYLGLKETYYLTCPTGGQTGYDSGDLIADTNPQSVVGSGCEESAESCGSPDPVHNYLNTTSDDCRNQFTSEQANRMACTLLNYRPSLFRLGFSYGQLLPLFELL